MKMIKALISAALVLALLAGLASAALADGALVPPPPVQEEEPLPEDGALLPETEDLQTEDFATEYFEPGTYETDVVLPETEQMTSVLPETAVPPVEEQFTEDSFVQEQTFVEEQQPDLSAMVGTEWDDPLYHKMQEQDSGISTASLTSDSFAGYVPRALSPNEQLRRGVDVSVYQYNVDWNRAAASGIQFAIVRTSFRGSTSGMLCTDTYYKQNLSGAHAAGLKVGAYIFSQATTVEEAREEARYLISTVQGYTIDLPLVFDFEETGNSDRRLKMSKLSRQTMTDICNAFCDEVEKAGYESMVYSNPYTLNNYLYRDQLGRLWLAHFIKQTTHSSPYEFWQCGIGRVDGISYDVDLDFWFDPSGVSTPPLNENLVSPTEGPAATPTPAPTPTTPIATPPVFQPHTVDNPFTDVSSDKWFYGTVLWAYSKGVVNGLSETSFGPNSTATRGQLVAMLYRMKGQPAVSGTATFTDLKEDYYKNAVVWASSNGYVSGFSQTTFAPNNKITREQLATMLYRMAGSPQTEGSLDQFTDAGSIHDYAEDAMTWAVSKGVITGYSNGTVRPAASATRAEVCTMLSRFSALG